MREREPQVEALRTRLARKFTTLADEVTECFDDFHIGGGDYVVELLAPEGVSTGGGKQALQHLRLRPRSEGGAVIVAGSVNAVEKRAELRTFEHARLVHEIRFETPFSIAPEEWEQLLAKAEVVLQLANIETQRVDVSPEVLREASGNKRGRGISSGGGRALRGRIVLLVALALVALVVARVVQKLLAG